MSSTISQPTAMRPRSVSSSRRSCKARSSTTVLATDSARPKTRPAPIGQPSHHAKPMPSSVAIAIWTIAPGMAIARTDKQVLEREMQPDAEHQQDDADFGELVGHVLVADIARRERPDQHAGEQIADQRRHAETMRQCAKREGQHEADDDQGDERRMV